MAKKDRKQSLTPKLRFPEFRDGPGWEERTIGDICHLQAGEFVRASDIVENYRDGLFPCYGGNGLRGYVKTFTHDGRYVVIGRQGALCGNVNLFEGKFHATEHALVATPNSRIDTDWLFYSLDVLKLNRFSIGQAQPGLSVTVLNGVQITVSAEKREQQRIAACLTSLDELLLAAGRKLEALQAHKQGLLQQLFPREGETRPRLRFPAFRDAAEWEERQLSSAIQLISGVHLSPDEYTADGEVPYFTGPSDFTNDAKNVAKWTATSANAAKEDDILITVKGSGVGETWYLTIPIVAMGRQLMAVRATKSSSRFIHYFLLTKRSRFEDLASGNLIPGLSRGDILDMPARLPSVAEQERIAACLSSLDALIAAHTRQLASLRMHKQGLLQQLFPNASALDTSRDSATEIFLPSPRRGERGRG